MRTALRHFFLLSGLLLVVCCGWPVRAHAQTVVVAHPVAVEGGWVAFQIDHVLRVEGYWANPPAEGGLIYPAPMKRAYPIARFGESVIIALPQPGSFQVWKGYHVHNGYIPALGGTPAGEFLHEIANIPLPPTSSAEPIAPGSVEYLECPICHRRHIRR